MLKRASYIDLLMAETRRAVQQSTPVTVTLMQFGKSSAMLKEHGEKAVEAAMQQIGQLFAANIRQNDLAFRYEKTTIALVLGETGEKEALMAVEKLRKLLSDVKLSDEIVPFSAGLAEAVVRQQFDPVDIVTEVINRVDKALDAAVTQGMGRIVSLAASVAARSGRLAHPKLWVWGGHSCPPPLILILSVAQHHQGRSQARQFQKRRARLPAPHVAETAFPLIN